LNDSLSPRTACPSAETLAVFLEGKLDPSAREAAELHLVECPDCYELFLGAGAILGDLEQGTGKALTMPARQRHGSRNWRRAGGLASAAVVVLAAGLSWRLYAGRSLDTQDLMTSLGAPASHTGELWRGRVMRGGGEEREPAQDLAIGVGATWLDLQLALAAGEATDGQAASDALYRLATLCDRAGLLGPEVGRLRQLASTVDFAAIRTALREIEPRLRARFDPERIDTGALWEAARLAALEERKDFFERRAIRRGLDRSTRLAGLPPEAAGALAEASKGWTQGAPPDPGLFEKALLAFDR